MKKILLNAIVSLAITCSAVGLNVKELTSGIKTLARNNEQVVNSDNGNRLAKQNARQLSDFYGDVSSDLMTPSLFLDRAPYQLNSAILNRQYDEIAQNNDCANDFYDNSEIVTRGQIIFGKIVRHSAREVRLYQINEIDSDWYRFSITERHNGSFTFMPPTGSSSYYYEIYRFGTNEPSVNSNNSSNNMIYSSRYDDFNSTQLNLLLDAGTYYIHVTAYDGQDIRPYSNYILEYHTDTNIDDVDDPIQLTNANLSQKKVVVWENENIPDGAVHWGETKRLICRYGVSNGYRTCSAGYVDPIYLSDVNWQTGDSNISLPLDERPTLDSIMYVSDVEDLKTIRTLATNLRNEISIKVYNEYLKSLKIEMEEGIWDFAKEAFKLCLRGVAYCYGGPASEVALSNVIAIIEKAETARAFIKAINFANNGSSHYVTGADACAYLQKIVDECTYLIEHDSSEYVLKLPMYSYLYEEGDADRKVYSSTSIYLPSPHTYDDKYDENGRVIEYLCRAKKGTTVNPEQRVEGDSRTYKGRLYQYKDLGEMWEKSVPIIENSYYGSYTSSNGIKYAISKRFDNKYYLDVTNTTTTRRVVMCNSDACTDEDGREFNFKADSYAISVVTKDRPARVCLDDRTYVWIRENGENTSRKLTFTNRRTTVSDPYTFGYEFVKLAIVKKTNKTWTIRVTNLYRRELEVFYNYKMCAEWDGEGWKNLKHITSVTVSNYISDNYKDVEVTENGMAGAIAFSVEIDNVRYISMGNQLNKDSKYMSYYNRTKYIK